MCVCVCVCVCVFVCMHVCINIVLCAFLLYCKGEDCIPALLCRLQLHSDVGPAGIVMDRVTYSRD